IKQNKTKQNKTKQNTKNMSKYASVITEIYEETRASSINSRDDFLENCHIRTDQFLITYPANADPYHWVYHRFEGTGCEAKYKLVIVKIEEVSNEFFTFHTQNWTHFKNPKWYPTE
ncbi:MAG: hypothetical protein WD512_15125, partial [Candidatus Paceibacterota bacterium]